MDEQVTFTVGEEWRGGQQKWVARDDRGYSLGAFDTQDEAVREAHIESHAAWRHGAGTS